MLVREKHINSHPPFGIIFDDYDMVDGYILDCIESSNMRLATDFTIHLVQQHLQQQGYFVPRVIAVGHH